MKGICNAGPAELSFERQADETSAFICRPTCPSEHVEQQSYQAVILNVPKNWILKTEVAFK
jgi:hypothetical protein